MKTIELTLIDRKKRTETIESFRFMPEERIIFAPGQFLQLIFDPERQNNKELNKYLSFSSSPDREYIEVTKRLSDSIFSKRLGSLQIKDKVLANAPLGSCIFEDKFKEISFLIGGIGITPVISIIEYIVARDLQTDVVLIYSNRTEEEIAFKYELDLWQAENKNIRIFYTVTECQPKDKRCIYGRIDKKLLMECMKDCSRRIFFIFGPPKMVEAMSVLCRDIGCPGENVRTEKFIGY